MKHLTPSQLAIGAIAALIIATGSTPAQTATARPQMLLEIKLDCGNLDGNGRVMVLIDRQVVELAPIDCKRNPA